MTLPNLTEKASAYLHILCSETPNRRVGAVGNRLATDFFAARLAAWGFEIETPPFDCLDWTQGGARLRLNGTEFEVFVSPYSLGFSGRAPLAVISNLDELAALSHAGVILLIRSELAKEQLMPKNFPFYNPDDHRQIISLLEDKQPAAIVAATERNPEMAGAVYPFPLFEDGDFDIPSVYMTAEEGARLAGYAGQIAALEMRARRIPAQGCNVVARRGTGDGRRVVFCAHIDAKENAPGAIDNAAGVVTLLLLGELLAESSGSLGLELVAINGEDYYSNPGEQLYMRQNEGRFADILLGVNLDGLGYYRGNTAYSTYNCSPDLVGVINKVFSARPGFVTGEPWYQGDHSLFLMNGRPALAITSESVWEIMTEIAHSPQDTPEVVDPARLAGAALALQDLLQNLNRL